MAKHDIQKIKDSVNIVDIIGREVQLDRVKAGEYKGICKFHEDTKPSMTVSENKQIFHCFVCKTGGDVIDYYTKQNHSFDDAINIIKGELDAGNVEVQKKPKRKKQSSVKSPKNYPFEFPELKHYKMGMPASYWSYKTKAGALMTIIRRYNFPDGKVYLPKSWLDVGNGPEWVDMQIPENRPLYNLELISRFPEAKIIIVEGEKCADFGQKLVNPEKLIFTTWIGGGNAIHKTDWEPLKDRKVIKWADNDDVGIKFSRFIPGCNNSQ